LQLTFQVVTINAGEEKEVAVENLAMASVRTLKMFQTCGSAPLLESREPSTRVREAMSIQVLHCPYG
jgi:hypothetical protein